MMNGGVLHGGVPGDTDPRAVTTGGLVGMAAFLAFLLGVTLWTLASHWWQTGGAGLYSTPSKVLECQGLHWIHTRPLLG